MSKSQFKAALDTILDHKLLPYVDFQNFSNDDTLDILLRQTLIKTEFVQFLLNFLKESAKSVLSLQNNDPLSGKLQDASCAKEAISSSCNFPTHFNKNLKIHNDAGRQRGKFPTASTFPKKTYTKSQECFRPTPRADQSRPFCKQNKREPIHLTDFLTNDNSLMNHTTKKRYPRKGRRVNLSLCADTRTKHSTDGVNKMHLEKSTSLHPSKSKQYIQSSKENLAKTFEPEDFPALSSSISENASKPSRRIKPTLVKVNGHEESRSEMCVKYRGTLEKDHTDSISANPFIASEESNIPAEFKNERDMLMKMKIELSSSNSATMKELPQAFSAAEETPLVTNDANLFSLEQVSFPKKLNRICDLYCYYLNALLVPSFISELHFIFNLLICASRDMHANSSSQRNITQSEDVTDSSDVEQNLLSCAPNCLYFAVCAIKSVTLSGFISIVNRPTLISLSHNRAVQACSPLLPQQLQTLADEIELKDREDTSPEGYGEEKFHGISNVMFEADTDGRSNFLSDKAFHAFRKHRDFFYVILKEYEEKKHDPNFQIQEHLCGKIRNIVSQVKMSGTCRPFVRLFIDQMLQEVSGSMKVDEGQRSESGKMDLLMKFKQGDPEKFKRLQSRFFESNSKSTDKDRDFLLEQSIFYKEFVLCADNYTFSTQLCNEIKSRISDIESVQVQRIMDDVVTETVNTCSVTSSLSKMISSGRLLGHLLGNIAFQPYNYEERPGNSHDSSIFAFILSAIDNADQNNHVLITIPWLVEYLKCWKCMSSWNSTIVTSILERLILVIRPIIFATKIVNTGQFYTALLVMDFIETTCDDRLVRTLNQTFWQNHSQLVPKMMLLKPLQRREKEQSKNENSTLDSLCMEYVCCSLIYQTFPALRELRSMVISCSSGATKTIQSQAPSRKIKPSTEMDEGSIIEKKNKQMQKRLEEHFFRGQPSSWKRTVEFVSERCASNCVKHLRSVSMLAICDEAEKMYRKRIEAENAPDLSTDHIAKNSLIKEIIQEIKTIATSRMHRECDQFCDSAVSQCMKCIASCETAEQVVNISITIAKRKSLDSVRAWLDSRLEELVTMSAKARLTKIASSLTDSSTDTAVWHGRDFVDMGPFNMPNISSISALLQAMKEYTVKMAFRSEQGVCTGSVSAVVPEKITREDVAGLLKFVQSLLSSDSPSIAHRSMAEILKSSPHLRSSLSVMSRELANRAFKFF